MSLNSERNLTIVNTTIDDYIVCITNEFVKKKR